MYTNVCHFHKGEAVSVTTCCLPWQCDLFLLGGGGREWVCSEGRKFALKGADSSLWELPVLRSETGLADPLPLTH